MPSRPAPAAAAVAPAWRQGRGGWSRGGAVPKREGDRHVKGQHDMDDQQRAALKSRLGTCTPPSSRPGRASSCDTLAGWTHLPDGTAFDTPRVATVPEAATLARLLDTFNRDYDTPTPGTAVLATRLGRLLAGGDVIARLTGDPRRRRRAPDPAPEHLVRRPGRSARRALRRAGAARTRTRLRAAHDRRGRDPTARRRVARDQRRRRRHRRAPVL